MSLVWLVAFVVLVGGAWALFGLGVAMTFAAGIAIGAAVEALTRERG